LLSGGFQGLATFIHGKVCDPLVPLDDIDVRPDLKKTLP
jgi:hypothetical protein